MQAFANIFTNSAEETLITDASNGDLEAFNQLVLNYQDMAYNLARAILGDADSAEEAVQESFIQAFQRLRAFRGGSFRSWLLKILSNSAYDRLRRASRQPEQSSFAKDEHNNEIDSPARLIDHTTSIQTLVADEEPSNDIYKVLDDLPQVHRTMLNLIDIYELDYAEAANILNIPVGTVKNRLARARHRMSEKLCRVKNTPYRRCCPA